MRQRHLRRWRKRIEEDPYRALFGASEDMLRGRGLEGYIQRQREMHRRGMQWIEKTLPKWMLEDMGLGVKHRDEGTAAKEEKDGNGYPKGVKVEAADEGGVKEREGIFRQPSYRNKQLERDQWNEGVESPSDSRRPREQPKSPLQNHETLHKDISEDIRIGKLSEEAASQKQEPPTTRDAKKEASSEPRPIPKGDVRPSKDAAARESSFIEEFLANKTSTIPPTPPEQETNKGWRQTSLERRAARDSNLKRMRNTNVPIIDVSAKYEALTKNNPGVDQNVRPAVASTGARNSSTNRTVIDFHGAPGSRMGRKDVEEFTSRMEENSNEGTASETPDTVIGSHKRDRQNTPKPGFSPYPRIKPNDWNSTSTMSTVNEADEKASVVKPKNPTLAHPEVSQIRLDHPTNPARSTSEVLKQLPEDDLDFLTADDVRASMGHMKGTQEDKAAIRRRLEVAFEKGNQEIDPMLEAKVVNDQYVRRRTSEMTQARNQTKYPQNEPSTTVSEQKDLGDMASKPVSVLETGLDFMSRWLHNGGNVFAQHFWQDPIQLAAGEPSGADAQFLKGIGIGVLKGRRAFVSIKDDLVEDIRASQRLVNRLNNDEIKASAGAARLYRELPSALKDTSDADASKAAAHKRIRTLRQALLDTDKEFKKACEEVDNMKGTSRPSFLQEKRFIYASNVLHKNAQLTRMAIFGLQGRIEAEAGATGGLVARELLHRLLTLQDTQLALSRLVSRSMQVLGINPKPEEEVFKATAESKVDVSDPSVVEALASAAAQGKKANKIIDTVAANKQLQDEVSKQKAAMHGLSDDGYKHPPKTIVRKSFEGPNRLAHSLFRPFGLQYDSLGKDVDSGETPSTTAAKKEKDDRELVKEVRDAYEDVYGVITVDHWQVPTTESTSPVIDYSAKVPETKPTRQQASIQMLKEDDVSPSLIGKTSTTKADSVFENRDNITTTEVTNDPDAETKNDASNDLSTVERFCSPGTSGSDPTRHEWSTSPEAAGTEGLPTISDVKSQDNAASSTADSNEYSYDALTDSYVPISYKTLIYNAETDKLSITTSQVPQPNPPITPIPLHEALATLSHPAKFVDHLPEAFHVIHVKPDVLSVRTASPFNATAEKSTTAAGEKMNVDEAEGWKGINPVDGTTTLSPTGFVGIGSDLDREIDFAERRKKADEYHREASKSRNKTEGPRKDRKGRVGVGGVVKTAIWAGALCYIVGVGAEITKAPFSPF